MDDNLVALYHDECLITNQIIKKWENCQPLHLSHDYCSQEWEIRLSIVDPITNTPMFNGVSQDMFVQVLEYLRSTCDDRSTVRETHEYCFKLPNIVNGSKNISYEPTTKMKNTKKSYIFNHIGGGRDISAKTIVSPNLDNNCFDTTHSFKQKLFTHDVRLSTKICDEGSAIISQNSFSICPTIFNIRLQHSSEFDINSEYLPDQVTTDLVRIKQRESFLFHSYQEEHSWRYDMTISWSGSCRTEAENNQRMGNSCYEIEIEYVPVESKLIQRQDEHEKYDRENKSKIEKRILSMLIKAKHLFSISQHNAGTHYIVNQ